MAVLQTPTSGPPALENAAPLSYGTRRVPTESLQMHGRNGRHGLGSPVCSGSVLRKIKAKETSVGRGGLQPPRLTLGVALLQELNEASSGPALQCPKAAWRREGVAAGPRWARPPTGPPHQCGSAMPPPAQQGQKAEPPVPRLGDDPDTALGAAGASSGGRAPGHSLLSARPSPRPGVTRLPRARSRTTAPSPLRPHGVNLPGSLVQDRGAWAGARGPTPRAP